MTKVLLVPITGTHCAPLARLQGIIGASAVSLYALISTSNLSVCLSWTGLILALNVDNTAYDYARVSVL